MIGSCFREVRIFAAIFPAGSRPQHPCGNVGTPCVATSRWLANTSAVAEVSSSWEAGASGLIAGVLAIVLSLRACAAVILRRDNRIACTKGQALQPRAIFIEAPALPMTGRALSPDAALARIEEIRRSLLDLTCSPSLAPSPTPEEEISPTEAEVARPMEKVVEPV